MKVLLVDPDSARVPPLAGALAAGGAEVSVAPSGSFALTMLEWNKQDVIVSRAHLGDMEAHELCAIVRADPSTKEVRFVVAAAPGEVTPAQTAQAGIDLVLPDGLARSAMVTMVVQLVRRDIEGTAAAPANHPAAAAPRELPVPGPLAGAQPAASLAGLEAGRAQILKGTLDVLELPELTRAIAVGGKTGRLLMVLRGGGGMIAFDGGRIVHAEIGDTSGESAFGELLAASQRERGGKFCFIPVAPEDLATVPRTIAGDIDRLLLGVATATDGEG